MAKSKTGGTRAMIRGRVGNDVYSIGLNGAGKKQQVVRSLAEVVANPQTTAQMKGRIIMSTIMQAVSGLRPIIDHSFDNVPTGQPSISEFISRNYKLIKDDIAENPSAGAKFALNEYQQKGTLIGQYVISSGKAILPEAVHRNSCGMGIVLANDALTVGGLKAALGWNQGDFLTLVAIINDVDGAPEVRFARFHLKESLADTTAISASNINSLFDVEGNWTPTGQFQPDTATTELVFGDSNASKYDAGVILSKKVDSGYEHSDCTMSGGRSQDECYDDVKDTYPNGSATFLNGGNLQ